MAKLRKPNLKQAIRFYTDNDELRVMNYSSIGDTLRRDGKQTVFNFLEGQRGLTVEKVERGVGAARHSASVVTDREKLIQAANLAGIKVAT